MTVIPTTPPTPAYAHVPSSTWSLPAQFTALDCFKIGKFADGQTNLAIVTGVPGSASATISVPAAQPTTSVPSWNNDTDAVIQLLYPAGSVNPGSELQGGVDLYANPLPMKDAHNVTMEYSVFIDKDFDFVKGGKLPGLYGGHMGCSGGNIANDCFSTRLMWRPDGAGELYLVRA
jgi:Polysaccharide lyase 14